MASAALVHPDVGQREPPEERSHTARVIEVDVRDHHVRQIPRPHATTVESGDDHVAVGCGARLHQCGLVPAHQVDRVQLLLAGHPRVEELDALGDRCEVCLHRRRVWHRV